jgi:hypothetical protein
MGGNCNCKLNCENAKHFTQSSRRERQDHKELQTATATATATANNIHTEEKGGTARKIENNNIMALKFAVLSFPPAVLPFPLCEM